MMTASICIIGTGFVFLIGYAFGQVFGECKVYGEIAKQESDKLKAKKRRENLLNLVAEEFRLSRRDENGFEIRRK